MSRSEDRQLSTEAFGMYDSRAATAIESIGYDIILSRVLEMLSSERQQCNLPSDLGCI
jgi:hypothetical protein